MKKQHFYIISLLVISVFGVITVGCKKESDDAFTQPVLSTRTVLHITETAAATGGIITNDGYTVVTQRGVCWDTSPNPTINNSKTENGTGMGSFTSIMRGLKPNTTYYVRAYATNSKGTGYGNTLSFTTLKAHVLGNFTDPRDGTIYTTINIGNQLWMAENLRYLPDVAPPTAGSQTSPHYYVYGYSGTDIIDAKTTDNYSIFGVLYNWPAAMAGSPGSTANPSGVQGVCPIGWHLPSDAEWTQLTDYLGGDSISGGKLKASGTIQAATGFWFSPNIAATNASGFTALPGGMRVNNYNFIYIEAEGGWWSSTEDNSTSARGRILRYEKTNTISGKISMDNGASVRCVKD
jgi:uncharacterized protein (TIGR02145 family)